MRRAKVVCRSCATAYLDDATSITWAGSREPCPPDEDPILVCVPWADRRVASNAYQCEDCGTLVAVAASSLWLLHEWAGPS